MKPDLWARRFNSSEPIFYFFGKKRRPLIKQAVVIIDFPKTSYTFL